MNPARFIIIAILSVISNTATSREILFNAGIVHSGNLLSSIKEIAGEGPYVTYEADFDNDSKNELIIGILCGNAGCENLIFKKLHNESFAYVTHAFFHKKAFQLIPSSNSKFSDIHLYRRSNASSGCLVLLKFDKGEYQEASKECGSSGLFYKIETEAIIDVEL